MGFLLPSACLNAIQETPSSLSYLLVRPRMILLCHRCTVFM
jgi:hypothetical protein